VSDRAAWLAEWCPACWSAPGVRCRKYALSDRRDTPAKLHFARRWRNRSCPTCRAAPDEECRTPSGRKAPRPHTARLRRGRGELVGEEVWEELASRGATVAIVPFSGRAGVGGTIGTIALSRLDGEELVHVERWSGRDELAYALDAPLWDRYGQFAGQPRVRGTCDPPAAATSQLRDPTARARRPRRRRRAAGRREQTRRRPARTLAPRRFTADARGAV